MTCRDDFAMVRALLAVTFLVLPLAAQQAEYEVPDDADRVEIYRTVDNHDLRVWIYEPEGHSRSAKAPAIVSFFGGGWRGGHPGRAGADQARYLAERGIVGIVPDYRVRDRHGVRAKDSVIDAKAAMRWVRAHAQDLGIDPNRVAAGGGSAGGHLAAATATLPDHDAPDATPVSPVPDALVLSCPAVIVPWAPMESKRLEVARENMGAPFESMSPYHHVEKDLPPTIIFQKTNDAIVDYNTVETFCEKAQSLGARCEVVLYQGEGRHCPIGEDRADSFRRMDAFFASLGWLDPISRPSSDK